MVDMKVAGPGRVDSLDVFRGATIAAMILVNNPGSFDDAFAQLRHAAWNGCTLTDWIFPFFLWIVGVAVTFSLGKRTERGESRKVLMAHVARRSILLFLLGLLVNGFPFGLIGEGGFSWATFRIPGVLQRIAVCYAVVSVLLIMGVGLRSRVIITTLLLLGYWLAMVLVPVPGYGPGCLEPTGNLCWYIDSSMLEGHTWVYAPAAGFDPEGILSTLPAIATTLIGTLAGSRLKRQVPGTTTLTWFLGVGGALVVAGLMWGAWFPLNKNLWSSSYVLFTGGAASICFGVLYWMVDMKGWKKMFQPFRVFGSNAITVFVASELLATLLWVLPWGKRGSEVPLFHDVIYGSIFVPLGSPAIASFLFALAFVGVMYLLAWVMWWRGWFVKL